jgi:hypothetical protein
MKNLSKKLIYTFYKPKLPETRLHLGYIFHTEQIFDQRLFAQLLELCESYRRITGKKAICTLMSGVNPLVVEGMKAHAVSPSLYVERARQLGAVSTLGYHGHFWSDLRRLHEPSSQIKGLRPLEPALTTQFKNDLHWFKTNGLDHNGIYSGGWWFMSEQVHELLIQTGFVLDFTFSKAPCFRNPYSQQIMQTHQIRAGEICQVEKRLFCVQNFIGCHTTPFVEDFYRNMRKLLTRDGQFESPTYGVVNSHDYDLDLKNTLMCIETLKKDSPKKISVEFWGAEDFRSMTDRKRDAIKSVSIRPGPDKLPKSSEQRPDHQTLG